MRPLEGQTVALLETRKAADLARLVERFGGTAVAVESVREMPSSQAVQPILEQLVAGGFDVLVIQTATAADAMFAAAERHGVIDLSLEALRRMTIVCRGPKPLLTLRRRGLAAQIVTDKPHTTDELLAALESADLRQARVLLLHYGERNDTCAAALVERGAKLTELSLYEWALPDDVTALERAVRDIIAGRVDIVLFTSQIQFRHLLDVAGAMEARMPLVAALRDQVVVGSVGPVCSRAIRAAGIVPDVMPAMPNGAALVQAVADYMSMFQTGEETSP